MQVLELVSDPANKTPLDKARMSQVFETVYQQGVMVRVSGNNLIMSPPLVIETEHVTKLLAALDVGLKSIA